MGYGQFAKLTVTASQLRQLARHNRHRGRGMSGPTLMLRAMRCHRRAMHRHIRTSRGLDATNESTARLGGIPDPPIAPLPMACWLARPRCSPTAGFLLWGVSTFQLSAPALRF